jgi:hypothetical protein
MSTIASQLAVATVLAASHTDHLRTLAAAQTNKTTTGQTTSAIGLVLMVVLVALLTTMAKAARGLATLMSGFLQIAASVTSVLFGMLIVAVLAAVILIHH